MSSSAQSPERHWVSDLCIGLGRHAHPGPCRKRPLRVHCVKQPHHWSQGNVTPDLFPASLCFMSGCHGFAHRHCSSVCDHLNSWPLGDLAPTLWPSLEVYGTPTCLFFPCFTITLIWNVWCFVMLYDNIWPFLTHDRYGKMGGNVDQQLKRQSENVLEGSLLVNGKHSSHNTRHSSAQRWWK